MEKQLHITKGNPPAKVGFPPIAEGWNRPHNMLSQPPGGLWTSTYSPDFGSDYANLARAMALLVGCRDGDLEAVENYERQRRCYLLSPSPGARVYMINDRADLARLGDNYGWKVQKCLIGTKSLSFGPYGSWSVPQFEQCKTVDWLAISRDFDAVNLTLSGLKANLKHPKTFVAEWCAESTIWFRWAFDKVEDLGKTLADYSLRLE